MGTVRRFELPYAAEPGDLTNPAIGLRSLAVRAGEYAPYTIDVTLLDAPDHRLIRAGVWLAHRVLDGRGEWYLATDLWQPWLPLERIEPLGHDDLMDLVRPFRRGATLGPVAVVTCERNEYALRGPESAMVAVLRDDRVQIRSGGVTTARYRELTLTGVEDQLTAVQLVWLTEALAAAGASRVDEFPPLTQRLGAPASGLSDLPPPRECHPGDSLELVWNFRLGSRLRALTYADLGVRGGDRAGVTDLLDQLGQIRLQLRGLTPLLDEQWATELVTQVDWAADSLEATADPIAILSSERYMRLLDQLVSASRAPALGDNGPKAGGAALAALLTTRLEQFLDLAGGLSADSPDRDWQEAYSLATLLHDCCVIQVRPGRSVTRLARRAARVAEALRECVQAAEAYAGLHFGELSTVDAFEAGRAYERLHGEQRAARSEFVGEWPRRARRLVAGDKG